MQKIFLKICGDKIGGDKKKRCLESTADYTLQNKNLVHLKTKQQQEPSRIKERVKRWGNAEESISEQWDKFKQPNIHVIGVPKGEASGGEKHLKI